MNWNSAWQDEGWSASAATTKTNVPPTVLASGSLSSSTSSTTAATSGACVTGDVVVVWILTGGSFSPSSMVVKDSGGGTLSVGTWASNGTTIDSGGVGLTGFSIVLTAPIPTGSTFNWTNSGATGPIYSAERHAAGIGPITGRTGIAESGTLASIAISDASDTPPLYASAAVAVNTGSASPTPSAGWTTLSTVGSITRLITFYARYTAAPSDTFSATWSTSSAASINYLIFPSA